MKETTTKLEDDSFVVVQERTEGELARIRAARVKAAYADLARALRTIRSHGGPAPWTPGFAVWYDGVMDALGAQDE